VATLFWTPAVEVPFHVAASAMATDAVAVVSFVAPR